MGIELAKAYIGVTADMSQAPKNIKTGAPAVENAMQGLAGSLNSILATVGIGLGISRIMSEARQAIGLASRQIDAEARVAAVIKTTGGAAGFTANELKKMASSFQEVTRVGDEAILEIQAKFLTFKQIQGDVFERGIELTLDMAAVMGTDARSAAIQMAMALEDPIRGVTRLRRAGVTFSDQQREQIALLVEQNRLMDAQGIVLEVIEGQLGGVAKAMAETDPGKIEQLGYAIGDVKEEIGKKLMPIMIKFKEMSLDAWTKISAVVEEYGHILVDLVEKWGPVVAKVLAFSAAIVITTMAIKAFTFVLGPLAKAFVLLKGLWWALTIPATAYALVLTKIAAAKAAILGMTKVGWVLVASGVAAATAMIVGLGKAADSVGKKIDDLVKKQQEAAKGFGNKGEEEEKRRRGEEEKEGPVKDLLDRIKMRERVTEAAKHMSEKWKDMTDLLTDDRLWVPQYTTEEQIRLFEALESVFGDLEQAAYEVIRVYDRLAEIDLFEKQGQDLAKALKGLELTAELMGLTEDQVRKLRASIIEDSPFADLQKSLNELDSTNVQNQLKDARERIMEFGLAAGLSREQIEQLYDQAVRESPLGEGIRQFEDAEKALKHLREGYSAVDVAVANYAAQMGVTAEKAEEFRAILEETNIRQWGQQFEREMKGPMGVFEDELDKLQKHWDLVWSNMEDGPERMTAALEHLEKKHRLMEKEREKEALMGAGQVGVAQFGQSIQAAMLQKDDPVVNELEKQGIEDRKKMQEMIDEMKRLNVGLA